MTSLLTLLRSNPQAFLLDQVTSAAAAYALRRLIASYAGYAIRVRRSSDNAEQDIGFSFDGGLDTVSLLAFVGSGSGFVTKWYDQSGNGRDAAQSTAANQPRIVNSGTTETQNTKPAIRFISSSTTYLTLSSGLNLANNIPALTVGAVANPVSSATTPNFFTILTSGGGTRALLGKTATDRLTSGGRRLDADSFQGVSGSTAINGALHVVDMYIDYTATTLAQFLDGAAQSSSSSFQTSGNTSATDSSAIIIGASNAAGLNPLDGHLAEILVYTRVVNTTNRLVIESNQKTYYGTP